MTSFTKKQQSKIDEICRKVIDGKNEKFITFTVNAYNIYSIVLKAWIFTIIWNGFISLIAVFGAIIIARYFKLL